jgi:hypothetical protein
MYTFVDFISQIAKQKGVPSPRNKEISYTNLVCWLGRENRLLLSLVKIGNFLSGFTSFFLIVFWTSLQPFISNSFNFLSLFQVGSSKLRINLILFSLFTNIEIKVVKTLA